MKQVVKSAAQAVEKAKKREYEYTDLNKLKIGSQPVNIYGVVLDASFPHKSFRSDKFICALKIIDLTSKSTDGAVEPVSVVFFASKFEDLPVTQRIGEIIRIHRATVGTFKEKMQLTVNICFNSSWALFAPNFEKKDTEGKVIKQKPTSDDFVPVSFFGKSMHCELKDKMIVNSLRTWAGKLFATTNVISKKYITQLCDVPKVGAQ